MIIKFQDGNKWRIFDEIDSLEYTHLKNGEAADCQTAALDYTGELVPADKPQEKRVELWFMNKNQLTPSQVIAYCPVYLMNNEGRTIETI